MSGGDENLAKVEGHKGGGRRSDTLDFERAYHDMMPGAPGWRIALRCLVAAERIGCPEQHEGAT